jgi:hypothetical protein
MTDVAQPLPQGAARTRTSREARSLRVVAAESQPQVSFAELVWAHHERQKEVYAGVRDGDWEMEYRRRLALFTAEHGRIVESHWCRFEASGIALTEQPRPRKLSNLFRRESALRLHTATDWRTANAPLVASYLHRWETAAIKAGEVLRETSEQIALSWIYAATSRLLAFADRRTNSKAASTADRDAVLEEQEKELERVDAYYCRAAENSARLVYFKGMILGLLVLAALAGGVLLAGWAIGWLDPRDVPTYTLFASIGMGAAGAVFSVMTRMAKKGGFDLDYEVGRKPIRFLGGLRPWIGALSALVLYLALESGLVEILSGSAHGIYYFATIAFLAGFSERRAKVILDGVLPSDPSDGAGDGSPRVPTVAPRPNYASTGGSN